MTTFSQSVCTHSDLVTFAYPTPQTITMLVDRYKSMLFTLLLIFCRFIYLNELNEGQINAYMRNGDNTLTLVQVCDNDKSLS